MLDEFVIVSDLLLKHLSCIIRFYVPHERRCCLWPIGSIVFFFFFLFCCYFPCQTMNFLDQLLNHFYVPHKHSCCLQPVASIVFFFFLKVFQQIIMLFVLILINYFKFNLICLIKSQNVTVFFKKQGFKCVELKYGSAVYRFLLFFIFFLLLSLTQKGTSNVNLLFKIIIFLNFLI